MTHPDDRDLGMDRPITRRDFVNGTGVALTGSLLYPWFDAGRLSTSAQSVSGPAPEKEPGYYPPALTGMRGTHDGAWEVAHELRDGRSWADGVVDDGEIYDLVVVGGGISGLAAAYFFQKAAGPNARVLVLDNHDDFGGHAKRNEFQFRGRTLIGYGGEEKPWVIGRKRFGRIAIANSDAGANAETQTAIDEAYRAVQELTAG